MEAHAAVTRIQEFRRHLFCASLECPRPDRLLEVPKMLPCLHRFCAECLRKELDRQLNNFNQRPDAQRPAQYRCPLDHCKELTGIQVHDPPHNLPRTDEFLENMVELYKLEESLANGEKLCDVCKRQRADRVCLKDSCRNKAFCQDCADHHALDRAAFGEQDGHQFLQVENLRRVSEGPVACGLDQKHWYCRKNGGEELRRYYCSEHDKVLCAGCGNNSQCVSQHHHCYLTVDGWRDQFPNHRPEVTEKLNNVKELQDRFRQAIDGIETRMVELEREHDSSIRRIDELHQTLIAELNRQKEKLHEKTREIYERKKGRLEFHLTKVQNACQSLNDVTDFVDSFLKVAKDVEFYYEKNQVSACLETIGERLDDDYCVTPQEEKLIKLSNHDRANDQQVVKRIDRVMGKVFSTPCVPFFTISDPHILKHLQVGHQTTITVVSRDVGGTPVKGRPLPDLTAYLEATNQDVDPQVIPCRIKKQSGKYLITMQPHHPYPMKLHIFHERPKPFPRENIVDCPNEGSEVIVERGFPLPVL